MAERSVLHQLLLAARDGKLTAGRIGAPWTGLVRHTEYDLPKGERPVLGRALWGRPNRPALIAVDLETTNPSGYPLNRIVKSVPYLTEAGKERLARFEAQTDSRCEREAEHPGMCARRCRKTDGCTERAGHGKRCTTGTFGGVSWAVSDSGRCAQLAGTWADQCSDSQPSDLPHK